jgi:hypothetical protein
MTDKYYQCGRCKKLYVNEDRMLAVDPVNLFLFACFDCLDKDPAMKDYGYKRPTSSQPNLSAEN